MIYIYRQDKTESGNALADYLGAVRLTRLERAVPTGKDLLVCWGNGLSPVTWPGKALNALPLFDKLTAIGLLTSASIPTVSASITPLGTGKRPDFEIPSTWGTTRQFSEHQARVLLDALTTHLNAPLPVTSAGDWIPRSFEHQDGSDLSSPPVRPDFYVKKETFSHEYRVHSFLGKSIRAGLKVHRDDAQWIAQGRSPSPWIKTWTEGWRTGSNQGVTKEMRSLAHSAVKALSLDFGAVDIGQRADGTLCVLEVNRAPGVDRGVIPAYGDALATFAASV